jgi:hypothetical protein
MPQEMSQPEATALTEEAPRAGTGGPADGEPEPDHVEREDHPWERNVAPHPPRTDSPEYIKARKMMVQQAQSVAHFFYGDKPYEDHHGGGLWLKDADGWFMVRNLAGIEWSAQFCADPKKVDQLRINARRLYAAFPGVAEELGIRELLDTPITDAAGVARWTDSICNASVALPPSLHTGVLPKAGGIHHYPSPVAEIALFKYDDFQLWVQDSSGKPAAVVPVSQRGSGDARVRVLYASPDTPLAEKLSQSVPHAQPAPGAPAVAADMEAELAPPESPPIEQGLILGADDPLAQQAFRQQTGSSTP